MTQEPKIVEVRYWREVKPPTLKQYVYRRAVKEAMDQVKGKTGITVSDDTGHPIPVSAVAAKDLLKGLTAERLLEIHPEWKEDYERDVPRRE